MRTPPQLQKAAPALYNGIYGMNTGGIGAPINPNRSMKENIAAQVLNLELLSEGMAGMVHAKEFAAGLRQHPDPAEGCPRQRVRFHAPFARK